MRKWVRSSTAPKLLFFSGGEYFDQIGRRFFLNRAPASGGLGWTPPRRRPCASANSGGCPSCRPPSPSTTCSTSSKRAAGGASQDSFQPPAPREMGAPRTAVEISRNIRVFGPRSLCIISNQEWLGMARNIASMRRHAQSYFSKTQPFPRE